MQCQNKFKATTRKRKLAMDNNKKSGSVRVDVEFEDELNRIVALDDSVEPEVLRGINFVQLKESTNTAPTSSSSSSASDTQSSPQPKKRWQTSKKGVAETLKATLLEIENKREKAKIDREMVKNEREQRKEANKQRRHEEKLLLLERLANIKN